MRILAIDPGTTESGWVVYDPEAHAVLEKGVNSNPVLLEMLESGGDGWEGHALAIEMIQGQGMAVGAETFETCVWIGLFMHAWPHGYSEARRVTRNQCKVHICGRASAKDPNVAQSLKDMFPKTGGGKGDRAVGTSKLPGPLFGMHSHMWPALAVAITAQEKFFKHETPSPPRLGHALRRRARL